MVSKPASPPTARTNQPPATFPVPAEVEARALAVQRMIEAVNNVSDEPGEDDRDFFRTIDAARPERPLFAGSS